MGNRKRFPAPKATVPLGIQINYSITWKPSLKQSNQKSV